VFFLRERVNFVRGRTCTDAPTAPLSLLPPQAATDLEVCGHAVTPRCPVMGHTNRSPLAWQTRVRAPGALHPQAITHTPIPRAFSHTIRVTLIEINMCKQPTLPCPSRPLTLPPFLLFLLSLSVFAPMFAREAMDGNDLVDHVNKASLDALGVRKSEARSRLLAQVHHLRSRARDYGITTGRHKPGGGGRPRPPRGYDNGRYDG
jgi:hypothetical protein